MEISRQTKTLSFSSKKIYDFIINTHNYKDILADEIRDFEIISDNKFKIKIGSLPNISLKIKKNPDDFSVKLVSDDDNLNFKISIVVISINEKSSVIDLKFVGKFSSMIEMMIKKPIEKFIDSLKNKIEEIVF